MRPPSWPLLYLAIALTTSATLLLELALTRIFAVVLDRSFAFLAISTVLFGLAIGAVLSYAVSDSKGGLFGKLGILSLINAGLVLVSLIAVLTRGADFALVCFASALPFTGAGIIVAITIASTIERVERVCLYGALGAAAGWLAFSALLTTVGGPSTAIASGVLFAASAAVWFRLGGVKPGRIVSVAVGLAFTMLVIANSRFHFFR